MARYYARFDHGYLTASGQLGETSSGNYFERRVIGSATSSNAVLVAARLALSDAMAAQLDGANRNPDQGPIIPQSNTARTVDNITRSGGNLSWVNVYKTTTIPGVVPPVDFRTRPTGSIYTDDGNLTAASPADGGSISDTLYTNATDAVYNVITSIKKTKSGLTPIAPPYTEDGSPYTRLGTTPSRTLHSLWHDRNLDYFAWDDFTPGYPQALTNKFPTASGVPSSIFLEQGDTSISLVLEWVPEFLSDRAGNAELTWQTVRTSGPGAPEVIESDSPIVTNGDLYYSASLGGFDSYGYPAEGRTYTVNSSVKFRDATISTHVSDTLSVESTNIVTIYKVYRIDVISGADANAVCTNTTVTDYFSDGPVDLSVPMMLYSNKTGTVAPIALYRDPGAYNYYSWDGGSMSGPTACPEGTGGGTGSGGGGDVGGCGYPCTTNGDCTGEECPYCNSGVCSSENPA